VDPLEQAIEELKKELGEDIITTGNTAPRPEKAIIKEAFDDFNERNPLAGGGMLVQPSVDGSRPGYSVASEKVINFAKQFKEKNGDLPTQQEIIKGTGAGSSTIKRHLKEGIDFKKVLSPGETSKIAGTKSGEKRKIEAGVIASDDKEGLKKLQTKVNKLNRVNNLKNKGIKFNVVPTQAGNFTTELSYIAETYRNKLNKTKSTGPLKDLVKEFNKFRKTSLFKNYDKGIVMREAGKKSAETQLKNIGSKKKEIVSFLINNKNATVEEVAKGLNIKPRVVRSNLKRLYIDIYKNYANQGARFLDDFNDNELKSVHDSIKNSKVPLKEETKQFVIDAYKGDKNLKPLLDKLEKFYEVQRKVKKTPYGKFFVGELDHVIPLNFLNQLEEGKDPMQLIRVRPLPKFLNQRSFKSQFDRVLGTAYRNRLKPGGKEALEAIVNLQSYLPQIFGGITPDGKITDYGAKPFSLKTNLSTANFGDIYREVFEFVKNPDLQDTFRESKVSFKNLLSQEQNILKQIQGYSQLAECKIDLAAGGRVGFKASTKCITDGLNEMKKSAAGGDKKAARQLINTAKNAATGSRLLKNVLGPGAILGEAIFEGALIGNKVLGGKPLKQAWAESFLSYLDPRKYRGELDPLLLERDRMLEQSGYKDVLRSGFAAQDQLSAANEAVEKRNIALARNRLDQYLPAAADAREQAARAGLSTKIISDEAFKDAVNLAQESIQGLEGNQRFKYGIASTPQGEGADSMRRQKAETAMKNLYTQFTDQELRDMLGPEKFDILSNQRITKRIIPSIATTTSGLDYLRSLTQEKEAMQRIADAGGVANLAGGGIAGLSGGIDKGPQRISMNPDSQGLSGLLKNDNKI